MIMNIILGATMYPTMLLVFLITRKQTLKRSNLIFGVHLPKEQMESEEVKRITERCRKQLNLVLAEMILLPIPIFFLKHYSVEFTLWMLWFFLNLVVMSVPFILANKKALKLKEPREETSTPFIRHVELNILRTVKLKDFLPAILISAAAAIAVFPAGSELLLPLKIVAAIFAVLTPLFYLTALWMDRLPVMVISEDSKINTTYARARKTVWKNTWLWMSWLNTAVILTTVITVLLDFHCYTVFLIATILESLLGILLLVRTGKTMQLVDQKYAPELEPAFDKDDDQYWIWGMFYYNPSDKRSWVEKRFGIGTTANMAKNTGKATVVVAVLALIWIPFMCIWMILGEFTPMHIYVKENTVICHHVKEDYVIPMDTIENAFLLEELPATRGRINGTGAEDMEKGKYNGKGVGMYTSFVNPQNSAFIQLVAEGKTYIICGETDAETLEVLDALLTTENFS
ncbi:MAG: DUF5808 domain-containing protein [Lachnospiraceae bacterium]|nr:DUF5808 domain-containing protein [Lachnospiraceae bacterium]